MIQELWILDFFALLITRLVLGVFLFKEWKEKKENPREIILSIIFLTIALLIILGYFTSLAAIFLLFTELIKIVIFRKIEEKTVYRIVLALVLIFLGPGELSFDYFLNVRF